MRKNMICRALLALIFAAVLTAYLTVTTSATGDVASILDWLGGLISSFGGALGNVFSTFGSGIVDSIWDGLVAWLLKSFYDTVSDVFTQIGGMGAEIFDLTWVSSSVRLFTMLGWTLFGVGMIVAAFDLAIEYQNGRASIKSTALNVLKGFFAANLVTLVPVELYKFCINLQNVFLKDLAASFIGTVDFNLGDAALKVLVGKFGGPTGVTLNGLFPLCMLIGLSYCVLKVFFSNIKRGGILLIQMAVGTLYLFSVPRGYTDGFNQWCKQIIALCLTAFLQTTLLFLGLLTFNSNMLLGLGIMLAAGEVPRIAQQFGLDSSVKVNMMSVVHATSTAVNMTRNIARAMA